MDAVLKLSLKLIMLKIKDRRKKLKINIWKYLKRFQIFKVFDSKIKIRDLFIPGP